MFCEHVVRAVEAHPDRVRMTIDLAARTPSISAYLNELSSRFRQAVADELVHRLSGHDRRVTEFTAALMAGTTVSTIDTVIRFWSEHPPDWPTTSSRPSIRSSSSAESPRNSVPKAIKVQRESSRE
ncbi:hypothetical protein GCM10029976_032940 [Kribbella albertanoniae]